MNDQVWQVCEEDRMPCSMPGCALAALWKITTNEGTAFQKILRYCGTHRQEYFLANHSLSAQKFDTDKPRTDLLSSYWLMGVASVLSHGAKKYAAHNWRAGIEQSRLMGAAMRHVLAFNGGEDLDPKSGLSHLLHASCCLMFAYELLADKPELDDRFKRRR